MTAPVPVLFGEVLFDCFDDGQRVLGGAPFNVAWHLQRFGCAPLFVSRVGDDPMGRQIRETMQRWQMSTAGLQLDSAHPTGEVRITLREGQPDFDILPDRAYDFIDADAMPPVTPSLIYHGSLGLRRPGSAAALDALVKRHPAPVFMDVNLRPPWWDRERLARLLDGAKWVKINDAELETLVVSPSGLREKADALMARHGLDLVIVTCGADGAFALEAGGAVADTVPAREVEVIDTVGAGDAFASVCILGLLRGWAVPRMLDRAQQFASLLVAQRGAVINDPAAYVPLLREWRLDAQDTE